MIPLMKKTFLAENETKRALADFILKTDRLSMGEKCLEFENAFALKQRRKFATLFNSGGSANLVLLQALKNLGRLKENDKIGFSSLTWSTNVMPIIQMGMIPVPVDCEPTTLNVMSYNLKECLKQEKLRALFITNALGFTGDLSEIRTICDENNILLLEDNCESLGTVLPGGLAGNFGLASTFSFFVAHHMSTIEGGMICTDDPDLEEMLVIARANGWDRNLSSERQQKLRKEHNINSEFEAKYTFYDLGFNFRPTEITGFLGLFQLSYLDDNIKIREKNYLQIENAIRKNSDLMILKHDHIDVLSTFAIAVVCNSPELRAAYISRFISEGIEIRPMIAGNMQLQPFYSKYSKKKYNLPGADLLHNNGFYCGNYPELTENDLSSILSCLTK